MDELNCKAFVISLHCKVEVLQLSIESFVKIKLFLIKEEKLL